MSFTLSTKYSNHNFIVYMGEREREREREEFQGKQIQIDNGERLKTKELKTMEKLSIKR